MTRTHQPLQWSVAPNPESSPLLVGVHSPNTPVPADQQKRTSAGCRVELERVKRIGRQMQGGWERERSNLCAIMIRGTSNRLKVVITMSALHVPQA